MLLTTRRRRVIETLAPAAGRRPSPKPVACGPGRGGRTLRPMSELSEQLRRAFATRVAAGALAEDVNFFEAGLTSARLAEVAADLRAWGTEVELVDLFTWPTLRELTEGLAARAGAVSRPAEHRMPWER
jgi:aryl carrier-like protein